MSGKSNVRVGGISAGKVWNEVIKAAIVSPPDWPNTLQQFLCVFGGLGRIYDAAESVFTLT